MEMETNDNEAMVNYGDVGFGLIVATRLAPLMHLGFWGSPILGIGSMRDLVISLLSLMVWSWLYAEDGGDTLVNEGMLRWFHGSVLLFDSWLDCCILLILVVSGGGYR